MYQEKDGVKVWISIVFHLNTRISFLALRWVAAALMRMCSCSAEQA